MTKQTPDQKKGQEVLEALAAYLGCDSGLLEIAFTEIIIETRERIAKIKESY